MEQNKEKTVHIQIQAPERSIPLEISAEFTLPDYRSEISRLLWVRPTFLPPDRFIGKGKAEFSGRVIFEVLYTGPDGLLYGIDPEEGYAFSIPLEGLSAFEGAQILATPIVDTVISRVTGPRKLSVRCRLHVHARGYAEKPLALKMQDAPQGAHPCRLCQKLSSGQLLGMSKEELQLSDTIKAEGDLRPICARGTVFLPEVCAAADAAVCRGELLLTALLCREDEENEPPFAMQCRIPFEQSVPLEGVNDTCQVRATGHVGAIELQAVEDGISLSANVTLCVEALGEQELEICRDLFLPGHTAECRMGEIPFRHSRFFGNRNFSINAECPLTESDLDESVEILDATSEAEIEEKVWDGSRFSLSGKLQCHLLCTRAGEICTKDVALPFRLALEEGGEHTDIACTVVSLRVSRARGALRADAELQLSLSDLTTHTAAVVEEVAFHTSPTEPPSAIELYYPRKDETLWDVAKRYAIPPALLAQANDLPDTPWDDPASLAGKAFLLIP